MAYPQSATLIEAASNFSLDALRIPLKKKPHQCFPRQLRARVGSRVGNP